MLIVNGYNRLIFKSDSEEHLVSGRMFPPVIGISEDLVTGNANGPRGAYLVKHGLVEFTCDELKFKAVH